MRLHYYITLICSVVLFVGCSSDEATMSRLYEAERIAEENPQRALEIMHTIDVDNIRGDEDMARYRLVYSEVAYYNRKDVDNDSLTAPLYDYYLYNHDNPALRARAMYQHALVKFNQGENAEAVCALLEADKSLKEYCDRRLEGLVYRSMGDIYGDECLFVNALDAYAHSVDCFESACLPHHALYSSYLVARILISVRRYSEGVELLNQCAVDAAELGDRYLVYDSLISLCYAYLELCEYANFVAAYSRIVLSDCVGNKRGDYYALGAVYEAYNGDFVKAEELYNIALTIDDVTPCYAGYVRLRLYVLQGDYKSAFSQYNDNIIESDGYVQDALKHNVLNTRIELLQSDIMYQDKLNEQMRLRYIYSAIAAVLLVAILVFYLYYKRKRYKLKEQAYIGVISELEVACSEYSSGDDMSKVVDRLYRQRFDDINSLCELYYEHHDSPRYVANIVADVTRKIDALRNDDNTLRELEESVNNFNNGAMSKLRALNLSLTEREQRIALYSFAGLSNRAICMLVECRAETLPKIKYGIREKIKQSSSSDTEFLILHLSSKKH